MVTQAHFVSSSLYPDGRNLGDGSTLVDVLESAVDASGAGDAVVTAGGEAISHAVLHARANRLARWLVARGLGPEDAVGLCLDDPLSLLEATLAVVKSGAAFMPLDPQSPPGRLAGLLRRAAPACVLTRTGLAGGLPQEVSVLCLDDPATMEALRACAATPLAPQERTLPLRPGHPAYVLHTSGSTGTPKGVVISHDAIAGYVRTLAAVMGDDARHMPLFTASTFDLTLTSLFVPLSVGGTISLFREGRPEEALAAIFAPDSPARAVKLTPSHIALLDALPPGVTRTLRLAIAGGEALTPAHLRQLQARAPGLRVLNEYGPTEATIGAVAAFVEHNDGNEVAAGLPIGRPYPGVSAHVLDERLRPCPAGTPGELYLAGPGLARGYRGQPALTAARFVASPFGPPGARLYRTGDIASWRADGHLLFHGRADDQVKIRGHRIEPAEIEAVLCDLPGITQAAVAVRTGPAGEPELAAWIAVTPGTTDGPDRARVAAHLAAHLPAPMIPRTVTRLERLPLTANGKLDRRALPEPADDTSGDDDAHVAPRTPAERLLCDLMAELTGRPRVGSNDHFFHLGGHSLLAARLAARIRNATGQNLPIRAVFDTPRIEDIAKTLDTIPNTKNRSVRDDGYAMLFPIRPIGSRVPLFCLHPVVGLCWPYLSLLAHTSPDQPIYGLQTSGARPGESLPRHLTNVLDEYISIIDHLCPKGPVRLLGWSFGGVLAHLMATRIQAGGRTVDRLILIDAYPPWRPPEGVYPPDPRSDGLWRDLAFGLDIEVPSSVAEGRLHAEELLSLAQVQKHPAGGFSLQEIAHSAAIMANNTQFMAGMSFNVYDGDILFVAGDDRPPNFDHSRMRPDAWKPYCTGNIHVEVVHSTHNRMLSPATLGQMAILRTPDLNPGA